MKKIFSCAITGMLLGIALLQAENIKGSEYDRGKNLYNSKCLICHGVKGDGKGPAAASFSPRPANFTNPKFWENNVNQKIADTIKNGYGIMPAFDMKPDEIKAIINYMAQTFKKE